MRGRARGGAAGPPAPPPGPFPAGIAPGGSPRSRRAGRGSGRARGGGAGARARATWEWKSVSCWGAKCPCPPQGSRNEMVFSVRSDSNYSVIPPVTRTLPLPGCPLWCSSSKESDLGTLPLLRPALDRAGSSGPPCPISRRGPGGKAGWSHSVGFPVLLRASCVACSIDGPDKW